MSLLPTTLQPPGDPIGHVDDSGNVIAEKNFWLLLYNLCQNVLGIGSGGSSAPSLSSSALIELASLDADIASIGSGGGSSSSSVAIKQTVVALTTPASSTQIVTVTDVTVKPTSKIMLSLAGVPPSAANEADDIDLIDMVAVPGSGNFLFKARFLNPISGPLTVNYLVA